MGDKIENIWEFENEIRKIYSVDPAKSIDEKIKKRIISENSDYYFKLGIHAAGFLFINPWIGDSVFLADFIHSQKNKSSHTYNTPYFFYNSALKENAHIEGYIQNAFGIIRNSQDINDPRINDPSISEKFTYSADFIKYLPINADFSISEKEKEYRAKYNIHYCTIGEILYTNFCWRYLYKGFETKEFILEWDGKKVNENENIKELLLLSPFTKGRDDIFKSEFENLKIIDSNGKILKHNVDSVLTFLKGCGIEINIADDIIKENNLRELYNKLISVINSFLEKISVDVENDTNDTNDTIKCFEKNVRFPVLAVYLWNAIDDYPHTYLVTDIWMSERNRYSFLNNNNESRKTSCVGYSLTSTSILRELDWTISADYPKEATNDTPFFDIKRTLNALGNPLVESAFYENLKTEMLKIREEMLRAKEKEIIAGIMARNLSHTFGSHILGSKWLYDNLGFEKNDTNEESIENKNRMNLIRFHHYLQARLDFIARIISDAPKQFETIFFFADLLKRFMFQEAIINTIAIDDGYSKDKIKFRIEFDGSEFFYDKSSNQFLSQKEKKNPVDFLIAIPGGITGGHAFYSIIENIIRNGVKYGSLNPSELIITIKIEDCNSNYRVTIFDNISTAKKVKEINELLNIPIVGTDENKIRKGNGMLEMKKCAEYISNKSFTNNNKTIIEAISLENKLAYQFYLNKPILIGMYQIPYPDCKGESKIFTENIVKYSNLDELSDTGSFFSLIIDCNKDEFDEYSGQVLTFLKESHFKLSYRLMLLIDNENKKKLWEEAIKKVDNFNEKRLKIIHNPTLIAEISEAKKENNNKIILEVYETWIREYKPLMADNKYKLIIGFESNIEEKWKGHIEDKENPIVDIAVKGKGNNEVYFFSKESGDEFVNLLFKDGIITEEYSNKLLLFDNHGNCFPDLSKNEKYCFKHDFGLKNVELYQELFNPPSSDFGFNFFLYSLIESSLTKVLIIDERILNSLESVKDNFSLYNSLNDAKINIVSEVNFKGERIFIDKKITTDTPITGTLYLDENKTYFKSKDSLESDYYDAVIIHHGKFEELHESHQISYSDLEYIYQISPVLLWTSGRGYDLKRIENIGTKLNAQFIDFNEVNFSTYLTLNKIELGKSILSKYGNIDNIK